MLSLQVRVEELEAAGGQARSALAEARHSIEALSSGAQRSEGKVGELHAAVAQFLQTAHAATPVELAHLVRGAPLCAFFSLFSLVCVLRAAYVS